MKKWISLFLAALLVVGMAACSAPAAAPDAQAGQAQADQPEASGEEMVVVEDVYKRQASSRPVRTRRSCRKPRP